MSTIEFSIFKNLSLDNKYALVTGGFGNIGIKILETLFELNCKVIVIDILNNNTNKTIKDFEEKFNIKRDNQLMFYSVDLSDKEEIIKFTNNIKEKYIKIDIIINCAALVNSTKLKGWNVPFEEQSMESFDLCMDINAKAPLILFQHLIPLLKKSDCAKVINISSIYGAYGNDFNIYEGTDMHSPIAYSVSKSALNIMTKYLASLYGKDKICINSIILGGIFRNQNESFVEKYNEKTPLLRMGTENDIKGLIAYLSSNLSDYMTGQNIPLDGGLTCKV